MFGSAWNKPRWVASVVVATTLVVMFLAIRESSAELENQVFTARTERFAVTVPRNWRVTDQPSYPGFLLWLMRSQPEGRIVVTAEQFTRALYCSWPVPCRQSRDPLESRYACALREKLAAQRMRVGPSQAGPKDNEANKFPSVWFEYDDGVHFLRQAIAFGSDNRIVSFVLSAPTDEARRSHARAFDQMLRTLHSIEGDARLVTDGGVAPPDAGEASLAPAQINPIGSCTN